MRGSSLWRLTQPVTSLTIDTSSVTLVQVRDIMAQLPNLDNLSLLGFVTPVGGGVLLGIRATVRGRFGGRLLLRGGYTRKEIVNMLEIPSGLHFTEVEIYCARDRLPSTLRLIEACGKTLVKLSYKVPIRCKSHSSHSSCSSARDGAVDAIFQMQMATGMLSGPSTSQNSQTWKRCTLALTPVRWMEAYPGSLSLCQPSDASPLHAYPPSNSTPPSSPSPSPALVTTFGGSQMKSPGSSVNSRGRWISPCLRIQDLMRC